MPIQLYEWVVIYGKAYVRVCECNYITMCEYVYMCIQNVCVCGYMCVWL